jgi:hypothetical protein
MLGCMRTVAPCVAGGEVKGLWEGGRRGDALVGAAVGGMIMSSEVVTSTVPCSVCSSRRRPLLSSAGSEDVRFCRDRF